MLSHLPIPARTRTYELSATRPLCSLKALRKAFRQRSRTLHPDVRAYASSESDRREPSIYELNAAYEAVRKIL